VDLATTCTACGPNRVLVQFARDGGPKAFAVGQAILRALERSPPDGLLEFVPAFTAVLLEFNPEDPPCAVDRVAAVGAWLRTVNWTPHQHSVAPKEIPVRYGGPDLDRAAARHGLTTAEVIQRHCAPVYRVYQLGFSPGFPYLGDLDPALHTPRLAQPRKRVAAGSVAIGGSHTGIYSVDGPGGWNLIGHTQVSLFDPAPALRPETAHRCFLLGPGDQVQFVPISRPLPTTSARPTDESSGTAPG
jgi:KipI family sensor histidine kinase inhibitor